MVVPGFQGGLFSGITGSVHPPPPLFVHKPSFTPPFRPITQWVTGQGPTLRLQSDQVIKTSQNKSPISSSFQIKRGKKQIAVPSGPCELSRNTRVCAASNDLKGSDRQVFFFTHACADENGDVLTRPRDGMVALIRSLVI